MKIGVVFFFIGLYVLILTFYPVILLEMQYLFEKPTKANVNLTKTSKDTLIPLYPSFGIVIPKIRANARVMPEVDPENERAYQVALTKGVAHAKGTALPGEKGNVFIFAHSAGNFYDANRYNAIFYLLSKIEKDDDIYLFYKKDKYQYKVREKKIVDASAVQYLKGTESKSTVTLMTCWPPGTTFKRLLVVAEPVPTSK